MREDRGPPGPLTFGRGNAKLDAATFTFSLPAGYTCPGARDCLSRVDRKTRRIRDGRHTVFRCYAATMELRPSVFAAHWRNFSLLQAARTREGMARLILDSLSPFARLCRVHDSGDYFRPEYLDAWLDVARARPQTTTYFYTKCLDLWVDRLPDVGTGHVPGKIPNVVPTASRGGKHDALITKYGLRSARVVFSREEADRLGLEVDHDDSHARTHGPDFALCLHGTQPAGSAAAAALAALKRAGWTGYGRRRPLTVLD